MTPGSSGGTTTTVAAPTTTDLDLTELWSFGLTSVRTGEPLIAEGGLHDLDVSLVSFGHNLVVDASGTVLAPQATPLQGGERLVLTDEYQDDHNVRAYAEVFTIMAPIRDTILYRFESTTREEWLAITEVLTINGIKTEDAAVVDGRSVLSSEQVYDYIASGECRGQPDCPLSGRGGPRTQVPRLHRLRLHQSRRRQPLRGSRSRRRLGHRLPVARHSVGIAAATSRTRILSGP